MPRTAPRGDELGLLPYARFATTGNIADLAAGAPNSVDGVTPVVGDRVLVWKQTTALQNGIYKVVTVGTGADGSWTRVADASAGKTDVFYTGTGIFVAEGSANRLTRVSITNTGVITINTTSLTFIQEAPLVRSDTSGTEVRASAALTGAYVATSNVDMQDFQEVDFVVYVTNKGTGPITRIDMLVLASDKASPVAADFAIVQAEAVSAGISTLSDYTLRKDVSGLTPPFTLIIRAPATGRFMQMQILAGVGNPATSAVSINAYRRS